MELLLRNANACGYEGLVDIAIDKGRIVEIGYNLSIPALKEIAVKGRFVSPGLVDVHTHLDKALTYERVPDNYQRSSLVDMIKATRDIKKQMTAEDVRNRALEVIKMSVVNGTTTIRTYVEADPLVEMRAVEGILAAKQEAKNLIDLQTIAFAQEGWFYTPNSLELGCEEFLIGALKAGVDVIGGNVNKVVWPSDPEKQVDRMFEIALEFDCDIDMHLDNADTAEAFTLPYVIKKTIEHNYQGRVMAGHVVGISHVEKSVREETIIKAEEASLNIAVMPSRIELTCVKEFVRGNVNVSVATDNQYDPFVYLGNANLVESMLLLARLLKVQTDQELLEIYKMGTYNAAQALRLADYGLEKGKKADIVVFNAFSPQETIKTIAKCIYVIKNGKIVVNNSCCLNNNAFEN